MRLIHVLIVLAILGVVGVVALAFFGFLAIGWLNQKNLNEAVTKSVETAQGYKQAKTPAEALEQFQTAVQKRQYKIAAKYCTKPYADALERSDSAASDLGTTVDQIRTYGKEKGLLTDLSLIALEKLDPFPKSFKTTPPVQKDSKAFTTFVWDVPPIKDPQVYKQITSDLDANMSNVLSVPVAFTNAMQKGIEIVKEGEDWKLAIPTTPQWDIAVNYFNDRHKTYVTGLRSFRLAMDNDRYTTPNVFETELIRVLRDAKPK